MNALAVFNFDLFCSFCHGSFACFIHGCMARFFWLNPAVDFQSDKDSKEDINKVFALFDDNNTGVITLEHLKRVARELGEEMSEVRIDRIPACFCRSASTRWSPNLCGILHQRSLLIPPSFHFLHAFVCFLSVVALFSNSYILSFFHVSCHPPGGVARDD